MNKRTGILLFLALLSYIYLTHAMFSGSHTVYKNKSTAAEFCIKCHPAKVATLSKSAHANAGCICHGYNPNSSAEYNINVAHNLTKQIYCTNCHSNYNTTGEITIHDHLSGINQSAHYITNNTSILYLHAKQFFGG